MSRVITIYILYIIKIKHKLKRMYYLLGIIAFFLILIVLIIIF